MIVHDNISLPRRCAGRKYANSDLKNILDHEGPGMTKRGPDTGHYSSRNSDISPMSVSGSIDLGGQDLFSDNRLQHLNKNSPNITEQTQTCVIRQSLLAGSCTPPPLSLLSDIFQANALSADRRAGTQQPIQKICTRQVFGISFTGAWEIWSLNFYV